MPRLNRLAGFAMAALSLGSWAQTTPQVLLSLDPPQAVFAHTPVGQTARITQTLTNFGKVAAAKVWVEFAASGKNTCQGKPLAAGASCTFETVYSPTDAGALSTVRRILSDSDHPASGVVLVSGIHGTSSDPPAEVSLTPSLVEFGDPVMAPTRWETLKLSNNGKAALELAKVWPGYGGFTVDSKACPSTLAAGHSCDIKVKYTAEHPEDGFEGLSVTFGTGHIVMASLYRSSQRSVEQRRARPSPGR
ncbi:hypothetical protein GCM10027034_31650 [Ramlibacter solisilvae]